MARVNYECSKCGKKEYVSFKTGTKPKAPVCEKCKEEMKRIWNNVSSIVVDEQLVDVGQMMLNSGMSCGKDKLVF